MIVAPLAALIENTINPMMTGAAYGMVCHTTTDRAHYACDYVLGFSAQYRTPYFGRITVTRRLKHPGETTKVFEDTSGRIVNARYTFVLRNDV